MRPVRPLLVLMIEDNPGDVELTRESLAACRLALDLTVAHDGDRALELLDEGLRPDLILLDLNLPRLNGCEVLERLRARPDAANIPVVILTSSSADADIARSYELGANCFVSKPVDLAAFQSIVASIGNFWFTVVELPPS